MERNPSILTLGEARRRGSEQLRQAGVEEADADAELLLLYLLDISKAALLRDWRDPFPEGKADAWNELLNRREKGIPVQYLVGEQFFYGRAFEVSEAVLIPRPETELLAEAVLQLADRLWREAATVPTVLDVGTGSGSLAVTLAAERPRWKLIASDLSPDALKMAKRNAERLEVASRIRFVQGDLLSPFLNGEEYPRIDVLVSNPPYIPSSDISGLQREVRDHEPRLALDGGEDGLNPYRIMASQLTRLAQLPRIVAWEVGAGQAADVAELLRAAANWDDVRFVQDYAGIDRHVIAVK
ncbi:peptide chain release factor N(5)-glutamine methyltransferase [Cohnella herbarum]|uniref:Release factor glutamine methyltransferase n=1 Tax=Cohnella herbarum TaxID=2728023 RepID=A0A7Z2VS91_9BACL|nr:peptide chain release factor N(5)-glutamine methyltransferase [Cohnella herbarum]